MPTSESVMRDYRARADEGNGLWNENANTGWGPTGMILQVASEEFRKDFLRELGKQGFEDVAEWHKKGLVHVHDMGMPMEVPYCCGHSFQNLMEDGLDSQSVSAGPAKHLNSIINHAVNHIASCANEWAGAQAYSDIDLYLAAYLAKDWMGWIEEHELGPEKAKEIAVREARQAVQNFIYHLNYSTRYGSQPPFSNITLAITCPEDMKDRPVVIAGEILKGHEGQEVTYGDLWWFQSTIAECFLDVMVKGDHRGRGFTFPVLTINATEEFLTHPLRFKVYELTAKYGSPFFQNFVNGVSAGKKLDPADVRAMCCRLNIDKSLIRKHTGGIFGAGDNTGSIIVITISLPYLAVECAQTGKNFYSRLREVMKRLREVMKWKRGVVVEAFNRGFLPTTRMSLKRGFQTFYTTFGFIGLWEAVALLTNDEDSFLTKRGMAHAKLVLHQMVETADEFVEEDGQLYNVEGVPAESASYKLARKAIKTFGSKAVPYRGTVKRPYFTNSTHLPVEIQDRLDLVMETQSQLQAIPSGGTVVHLYTGEVMTAEDVETAVKQMCKTSVPYFSITTVYSVCPICGYKQGIHDFCEHTEAEIRSAGINPEDIIQ